MTITVNGPNGITINFPDGTDPNTINRVMTEAVSGKAQPRSQPGMMASALEGAAQGLTFGFSDEIEGAARAGISKLSGDERSLGELYDEGVAAPRGRIKDARASHPVAFGAGEIGSAVALPLGAAGLGIRGAMAAAGGRGLGARTVAGAKEGAVYGGLYGTGTAEGGVGERLKGAAEGVGTGALIGAAMPGAVDAASAVGSRIAAPFRNASRPHSVAAEKVAEAVERDFPGRSPAQFGKRVDDLRDINPSTRVMDAGGDNVRSLMRAATNVPNASRDRVKRFSDARQGNQWKRLENSLIDTMRPGQSGNYGANYFREMDRLAKQMDDEGKKLIQPALQIETPMTDKLRAVMARPTMIELWGNVKRKLADQGDEIGLSTRTQAIHRMKMELDEAIGMSKRQEKMGNKPGAGWDTRTLTILKRDLMDAVDNPDYKAGLRQYASTAQLQNALEDGYEGFTRQQPEQIRKTLGDLDTDAQREFYRFGAVRAVVERLRQRNASIDRTDGLFSSPEMQLKLKEIFPTEEQFRRFQRILVTEAKMADSRKAMQGNSTTARQLAEGEEAGKTASAITEASNAAGGSTQSALNLLARGYNRFTGVNPKVAAGVLDVGMAPSSSPLAALVRDSIGRAQQTPMRRAATSQRAIAGGAAGMTWPLEVDVYPGGDPRSYR